MTYEPWPSPESRRGPLPRIEDLPVGEQGYDQEAVREAFDAFYRHAAQLDASLKALEAVEAFRRDALELRGDLRSLQALGVGFGRPDPAWSPSLWAHERPRAEVPSAVPRLAAEAALLIGVAVVAGVADFRAWLIVALMGAALAIALAIEGLAARARTRVPAALYEPLSPEPIAEPIGEPAPFVEASLPDPGVGWSAFEPAAADEGYAAQELSEDTEEGIPVVGEPEPADAAGEAESSAGEEDVPAPEPVAVAVDEREPWERGFDGDLVVEPETRRALGRLRRRRRG